jgi:hypothetical protein
VIFLAVRIKGALLASIDDTETRRLKLLKLTSKTEGATLSLELPEALCGGFAARDTVNIVIDSKPIAKGAKAKLYMEGSVFRISENGGFEVVGTIGGLRMILALTTITPTKKKIFDTGRFFIQLS